MKRPVIIALLILISGIGIYAWIEFNREPASLIEKQADFTLSAEELYVAYETDEKKAEEKFTGKIIELEGTVEKIESSTESIINVLLKSGESKMGGVLCSFEKLTPAERSNIQEGRKNKNSGGLARASSWMLVSLGVP